MANGKTVNPVASSPTPLATEYHDWSAHHERTSSRVVRCGVAPAYHPRGLGLYSMGQGAQVIAALPWFFKLPDPVYQASHQVISHEKEE